MVYSRPHPVAVAEERQAAEVLHLVAWVVSVVPDLADQADPAGQLVVQPAVLAERETEQLVGYLAA